MKYLIPVKSDLSEISPQLTAAKITVNPDVGTVRDFILAMEQQGEVIIPVTSRVLLHVNSAHDQFLNEVPDVLMAIPGVVYDGSWMQQTSMYPVVDFSKFAERIRKTGHTMTQVGSGDPDNVLGARSSSNVTIADDDYEETGGDY